MHHHAACLIAVAALLVAPRALAQGGSSSVAEELFLEGKALMQEQRYELACQKLQASHDLDNTATGTLLNLALCHELVNKPATAWAELRQVEAESAGRREDRVKLAREHEAKLVPILSRIRIFVPPDVQVAGLSLRLDKGPAIAAASWGIALPIDPGKHVLEATAPGKLPRAVEFVVKDVADRQTISIDALDDAPIDPSAQSAADRERLATLRGRRVVGYTLGGVGVVAVGVGLTFGLFAANKNKAAGRPCPNDLCQTGDDESQAQSSLSSARTFATLSNLTVGAGALLVASGVVLVLSARPGKAPVASPTATRVRILPAPMANGGALLLTGEL
jgi:hypothetical protein